MAASTYAALNPQSVDPYNIEAPLATGVMDPAKVGAALPLLMAYQSDRRIQGQNATRELADAHEFNRQKLAAEMAKTSAETMISGADKNALDLLFGSSATRGLFGNIDPRLVQAKADLGNRAALGGILKDYTGAAYSAVQSGNPMPAGELGRLVPEANFGTADPLALREAAIQAASRGGEKEQKVTFSNSHPGTGIGYTINAPPGKVAGLLAESEAVLNGYAEAKRGNRPGNSSAPPPRAPASASTQAIPQNAAKEATALINAEAAKGNEGARQAQRNFVNGQAVVIRGPDGKLYAKGDGNKGIPLQ
jgi:hypothetical protein